MLDAGLYFFWCDGAGHKTFLGEDAPPVPRIADAFRITHCAEGQLMYFTGTEAQRQALLAALGHEELCGDPRFMLPGLFEIENRLELGRVIADPSPMTADLLVQSTDEVLSELGRTPEQIALLRQSGVIA